MRAWKLVVVGLALSLLIVTFRTVDASQSLAHVSVRGTVGEDAAALEDRLRAAGMSVELALPAQGRWQGWIDRELLPALGRVRGVIEVSRPNYGIFAAGTVNSEGDDALGAAAARIAFGVDGSGVRVAVISNGVTGLDQAQKAGDAPAEVQAHAFGSGNLAGGDEGTAMIEIIHDLAPGAIVSFGAVATDLDHMAAVNWFAARVDVIVDDVSFFYPADQASAVSMNTTRALEHPDWPLRVYVTAAGNWAERHWAGEFTAGIDGLALGLPTVGAVHRFGGDTLGGHGNGFWLDARERVTVALHWDDEWGRSTNDYRLFLVDARGAVVASSETSQGIDSFAPQEVLQFQNPGEPARYAVIIQNWRGAAEPRRLDLFAIDHSAQEGMPLRLDLSTAAGSLLAQSDAREAITVGAAPHGDTEVAHYSSRGPTWNGAQKPELAAVDGVAVSEATTFRPRFSGSSAAAPHVAAAAALMLQTQPSLLARDGGNAVFERRLAREFLLSTARDIGVLGMDTASGHGLLNVLLAVRAADRRVLVVRSPADHGPGTLREAIELVNAGDADIILFDASLADRTIQLESALPPIMAEGVLIDGSGWTLAATMAERGIELLGDRIELWGLRVTGAGEVGVRVEGDEVRLEQIRVDENGARSAWGGTGVWIESATSVVLRGVEVVSNWGDGITIEGGASAAVEQSWIGVERGADETSEPSPNLGYGIRIVPAAGDVRVGPERRPEPVLEADQGLPIGALPSAMAEQSGVAHTVRGWVTIDGVPAPADTLVSVYLDRMPAGVVAVDGLGRVTATVSGPGRQLRFAVGGVENGDRIEFIPGAESELALRTASSGRRVAAAPADGNVIAGNALGGVLIGANGAGARDIWGNVMWGQQEAVSGGGPAPSLSWVTWRGDAASLGGRAEGASRVDVYGGTQGGPRRYVGSALAVDGRFVLERVAVGAFDEFTVFAFDGANRVSTESAVWQGASAPRIDSVQPSEGGTQGGDLVAICGQHLVDTTSDGIFERREPEVWFGGSRAVVASWTDTCLIVRAPAWPLSAAAAGLVDVALRRPDGRIAALEQGYRYAPGQLARLSPGWNLTSWSGPLTPVEDALGALASRVRRVYAWDGIAREWRLYSRELAQDLVTLHWLTPQMSLWILLDGEEDAVWEQPSG